MLFIKVFYIKKHVTFLVSKDEEITMPNEFIFVFFWYFIGPILSKKSCQKWGIQEKDNWGGGGMTIQGVVYRRGGLKPSVHYVGILSSLQSSDIRRKLRRGYFQFPVFQIPYKQKLP